MIDFSTLKGLTIPEGVVTQIEIVPEKATITLTGNLYKTLNATGTYGNYVEYNGTIYATPCTFEAAIGDTIIVHAGSVPSSATIRLNGTQVISGLANATYSYTVVGNTTINGSISGSGASAQATMEITEQGSGGVVLWKRPTGFTVNIKGTGNASYCYVTIDGTKYTSQAIVTVAPNTVISCNAGHRECDCGKEGGGGVYLNSNLAATKNYSYTVTKNATITLGYSSGECKCDDSYRYASVDINDK